MRAEAPLCALLCLVLAGCATLGPHVAAGTAPAPAAAHGPLQAHATAVVQSIPANQDSAYWLLDRNEVAWTARLALTDEAVSTLDLQYFIWQTDATGRLLLRRVLQAADRGVQVRLLLDDFALVGQDRELAALDAHQNIEVRVFNPWRRRATLLQPLEFILRFGQLNQRMHNKVYAADGHFAIVGGRNIGDRYFGLHDGFIQNDLDVLVAGAAARQVVKSFNAYWTASLSYPGSALADDEDPSQGLERLRISLERQVRAQSGTLSATGIDPLEWSDYLATLADTHFFGRSRLHVDSPRLSGNSQRSVADALLEFVATAREEVLISTPYFIPRREFVELLGDLAARGVRVAVVTNSLASNNQSIAHTGYRRWRRPVLRLGVELYEFRRDAALRRDYATPPVVADSMGLHTKAVVVDRRSALVGSPNVDPRSLELNTELALAIDGAPFAAAVAALIDRDMSPENAWRVSLTDDNWLLWSDDVRTVSRQPARGFGQRMIEFFLNLLPVKGQL